MTGHNSSELPTSNTVYTSIGSEWVTGHPLATEGCQILYCLRGHLKLTVDSRCFSICPGKMAFIVFDMVAVPIEVSDDFKAEVVSLNFDTAQEIFFLTTSNRFWEFVYSYPVFSLGKEMSGMVSKWFSVLSWISENCTESTFEKTLRNEIENFMSVMAEIIEGHLGQLGTNPVKNRAWMLINEFLGLLNRHYTRHHNVAFYADKLHITPNYLNIIAKTHLGVTAKEQINIQLGLVVKMLLETTDLSVKEIAQRLNYEDPSYLCRVFRKQTGCSPIHYRNLHRKL